MGRSITERIADIIAVHGEANSMTAAEEILASDVVNAHFENKIANEQVRELRRRGSCPTCGAEDE